MKKIVIVFLVLLLGACTTAPKAPTATEVPVAVQPTNTDVPVGVTDTPVPASTDTPAAVATDTEVPTEAAASSAAASAAPAANSFGDFTFTNRDTKATVPGNGGFDNKAFAFSCGGLPTDVNITVTTTNTDIYKINYVYRLTAIDAPTISSGWSGDAKMTPAGGGKFTINFESTVVKSDWRTRKAWLDLQFIAFDNQDVTYSSPQFNRLITYNQCP